MPMALWLPFVRRMMFRPDPPSCPCSGWPCSAGEGKCCWKSVFRTSMQLKDNIRPRSFTASAGTAPCLGLAAVNSLWAAAPRPSNIFVMAVIQTTAEDRRLANLMQAAQSGDASAYAQLLGEIAPRIRRIVRAHWRFLGAEDGEGIGPEVLVSLHVGWVTY